MYEITEVNHAFANVTDQIGSFKEKSGTTEQKLVLRRNFHFSKNKGTMPWQKFKYQKVVKIIPNSKD